MNDEKKIIIAFLFKRSGKKEVKASDLYLTLSLELGWFSSQHAKQFIEQAVQQKLLENKNDLLSPTFDITTIDIPVGFRPAKPAQEPASTEKQDEQNKDSKRELTEALITHICQHTSQTKKEIQTQIHHLQTQKQLCPEVAAMLLAHKHNIPTQEFFSAVEQKLLS